ncbi:MAG: hypothetical protein ABR589_11345 [Chthoniobacterales bacterium]
MNRAGRLVVALALLLCAPSASRAALPERSISTSRQFIVYGPEAKLRGAICELAEDTKRDALALLQQPDNWKTPIVVNAQHPQANLPEVPAARITLGQTGFGLKLQLDLTIAPDANAPALKRELLRAILLEMIYRQEPATPAGAPIVEAPFWLVEGILALVEERHSSALAQKLETVVASNKVTTLNDFLRQDPALLESPSRALFRAYAAALVSMLTDFPDGRPRLARFLVDLPRAGNDALANIQAHFPAIGESVEMIEKTWRRSVARLAAGERYRLLGCEETERQLAQLLRVEVPQSAGPAMVYPLEQFPTFARNPASRRDLKRLSADLLLLSTRANPLYRSIIAEYQEIVARLLGGKTRRIRERLAEAGRLREQLSQRMSQIEDYMNWFEATQPRSASGVFAEYHRTAEGDQTERRRDPISVYLDVLESQL